MAKLAAMPSPPRARVILLLACGLGIMLGGAAAAPAPAKVRVEIDASHGPVARFKPDEAFGAGLDGAGQGDAERLYTPHNVAAMRSAGLKRVTYRLRTELGIEAWHWNPEGRWSDPAHAQGYWTSSDTPKAHPKLTWGYSLPRRGDTVDQANNQGYSRLDDGDPLSFWKSNPYLDRRYTGLAQSRPQTIVVTFKARTPIDAARIQWGTPFATRFLVQYWSGRDPWDRAGRWTTFPHGALANPATPNDGVVRLAIDAGEGHAAEAGHGDGRAARAECSFRNRHVHALRVRKGTACPFSRAAATRHAGETGVPRAG